jgi:hypothetical protein
MERKTQWGLVLDMTDWGVCWTGNLSMHLGSDNAKAHLESDIIDNPGPSEPELDGSVVEHLVYIQEVLGSIPRAI